MRPRSRHLSFILPMTLAALLSGCISSDPSPPASPSGPSVVPSPGASGVASAPPGSASPDGSPARSAPAPSNGAGGQTDTEWGRIWDDLPAGFPRYPGSAPADDTSPDPVSATYAVVGGGDAAQIASWMQAALETTAFSTEALSGPLEDGSFVLDSVGEGDCRIQVVIGPMGGLVFVTVRYGAACPTA